MKKENVLSKCKAQFCVLAIAAVLLLAAVLGVGISARAEDSGSSSEVVFGGTNAQSVVLTKFSEYSTYEKNETHDINVYCNGVIVKTFNNVDTVIFNSGNEVLKSKLYSFYIGFDDELLNNFYDFTVHENADIKRVFFNDDITSTDKTIKGVAVAFLSVTGFNQPAITCSANETQPLPEEPVEEGYTFGGWYLDEAYTQPYEGDAIFGDITLYAKMNIKHYNIKYIVWDGEAAIAQNNIAHFSYLTLPTPEERAGYIFVGWTNADGSAYDNTEYVSSNMTLYAKWERQKVKVTFKMPDGTVYKELTVAYGTKLVDAAAAAGVSTASFRAYYSDNVKLARNYEVVGNEVIEVKDMTKTEKTAAYISEHFGLIWAAVGIICALILISAISITVAVKRR